MELDSSPGGCATGECLPDQPAAPAKPAPIVSPDGALTPAVYESWRRVVDAVRNTSPRHGKSLAFGRLIRVSPGEVVISFMPEADFHRTTVSGHGKATIETVMGQLFGVPTRLTIDSTAARTAPPSIAEEEAREKAVHERSVEYRVRSNTALQSALRILGGEIEHIQVLERERPSVVEPDVPDETA